MSLESIYGAVLEGDTSAAKNLVYAALHDDIAAGDILNKGCIAAMNEVGRHFDLGIKFIPEVLISARAMSAALNILKPYLTEANIQEIDKVIAGSDSDRNLAAMILKDARFETFGPGIDARPETNTADENTASLTWLLGCQHC